MSTSKKTNKSATQLAYETIRNGILDNSLAPGSRLTIRAMAQLTGVSIIPVIQAFHRLENEGLIETFPRWGSRVITLDRATTRDRYLLREAVECQVVRILATQLARDQAEKLKDMAQKLDEFVANGPLEDSFWLLDHRFHLTMAEYTESRSLHKALGHINLFRLMQRTREQVILTHIELPADLHRSLVGAILSGEPDAAEHQMREHISASTRDWLFRP